MHTPGKLFLIFMWTIVATISLVLYKLPISTKVTSIEMNVGESAETNIFAPFKEIRYETDVKQGVDIDESGTVKAIAPCKGNIFAWYGKSRITIPIEVKSLDLADSLVVRRIEDHVFNLLIFELENKSDYSLGFNIQVGEEVKTVYYMPPHYITRVKLGGLQAVENTKADIKVTDVHNSVFAKYAVDKFYTDAKVSIKDGEALLSYDGDYELQECSEVYMILYDKDGNVVTHLQSTFLQKGLIYTSVPSNAVSARCYFINCFKEVT